MYTNIVSLADGCPKNKGVRPAQNSNPNRNSINSVRCCSKNGDTCVTPKPCLKTTLVKAQERCARMGKRLCTEDELARNTCCGTGCNFDNTQIWSADSNSK